MKAKAEEPELQFDTQAEGHGRTRFDANIVTLSGRVVSKDVEYVTSYFHYNARVEQNAALFVLNVVRNHDGAATVVDVPCRLQGVRFKATEGDMIAVLGELGNTRDGKGLYVEVKHWHLLEPHSYRQGKQNIAGSNETQEGTASEAK